MSNVWMPLYVADYLADTTHLSAAEHGAYLLLIMAYWQSGRPLPDDDAKLARMARMAPAEWRRARDTVAEFFVVEGGMWFHGRIAAELTKAERITDQKRTAGKASAERRAQRQGNGCSTAVEIPLERQDQRRGNQSPSPSPRDNKPTKIDAPPSGVATTPAKRGSRLPDDWEPTPDDLAFAEREGFPPDMTDREAAKFRDFWHAKPGKDGRKLDWSATWRNWLRNANRGGAPPRPTGPTTDELMARIG